MPRSPAVDAWFARYENPMKDVVLHIREIVLRADARIEECIKWQAPTFTYKGNLASFYPKSKEHASLMFHQGAQIPGRHARLEGTGDTSRVLKIATRAEAKAAERDLSRLVKAWCDWRDAATTKPRPPKRAKAGSRPPAKRPTLDDVARIALELPEVTEGERHGTRTWSVGGKVLAWERPFSKADIKRFGAATPPDGPIIAVRVEDLGEKEAVLASNPKGFFTIPHFDGYAAVLVQLETVAAKPLREALVDGWLACAPPALAAAYVGRRKR